MGSENGSRERLLREAAAVFGQAGYDALSFRLLALKINCPQPMLCYHFRDRETLLSEIIRIHAYGHLHRAVSVLLKTDVCSIRRRLRRFAVQVLLVLRNDENALSIFRRTVSELPGRGLTALLFEAGLRQVQEILTDVIDSAMQHREIRFGNPGLLSCQYFALLNNIIAINLLLKERPHVSVCQIRKSARESVDLFLDGALALRAKEKYSAEYTAVSGALLSSGCRSGDSADPGDK